MKITIARAINRKCNLHTIYLMQSVAVDYDEEFGYSTLLFTS